MTIKEPFNEEMFPIDGKYYKIDGDKYLELDGNKWKPVPASNKALRAKMDAVEGKLQKQMKKKYRSIKEQILAKLSEKKSEDDAENKYDFDKGAKVADKKHGKFRKDMEKKATKTKEGGVKVTRYPPQDTKPHRPHKGK